MNLYYFSSMKMLFMPACGFLENAVDIVILLPALVQANSLSVRRILISCFAQNTRIKANTQYPIFFITEKLYAKFAISLGFKSHPLILTHLPSYTIYYLTRYVPAPHIQRTRNRILKSVGNFHWGSRTLL